MTLDNISVDDITKMAALAAGSITLITKLALAITDIINKSKEMSQDDKDKLIAEIKAAMDAVPAWDNL